MERKRTSLGRGRGGSGSLERRESTRQPGPAGVTPDKEPRHTQELSLDTCICDTKVKDGDNGIQCDYCDYWFHAGCAKLPQVDFKIFKAKDYIWMCRQCKPVFKKRARKLESDNEKLREEIQFLKSECAEWRQTVQSMKEEIVEETVGKVVSMVHENIRMDMRDMITEELREREEKEKRKKNLVIYKVRESDDESVEKQKEEDLLKCKKILGEIQVREKEG